MMRITAGQDEKANSVSADDENKFDGLSTEAMIFVYGHGSTKNPFYEQARAIHPTLNSAVLILSAPVSRGQKLLLMNGSGSEPVQAEVVGSRTLDTQTFEVAVSFAAPRPNFWTPFRNVAKTKSGAEKRRSPRIELSRGMPISWYSPYRRDISRVSSLSTGGLFIDADDPAPEGQTLQVQFELPSGPVLGKAVVRRSIRGKGMGVEFTELPETQRSALSDLMQRLLGRRNRK